MLHLHPPIHFQGNGENDHTEEGSDDEEQPRLREDESLVIEEYDSQVEDSDEEGSSSAYAGEHEIARPEYAYLFHCIPGPELRRKKGAGRSTCVLYTYEERYCGCRAGALDGGVVPAGGGGDLWA